MSASQRPRVAKLLQESPVPLTAQQITKKLNLKSGRATGAYLRKLKEDGLVVQHQDGAWMWVDYD
jgi:DNA-binding transcriptional ArsR family regulator